MLSTDKEKQHDQWPALIAARVDFITPEDSSLPGHGNDKDDNTGVEMHLFDIYGGERLFTKKGDGHGYFKDDDSCNPVDFNLANITPPGSKLTQEIFRYCSLSVKSWPDGDDTWIFVPTVVLTFEGGIVCKYKTKNDEKYWYTAAGSGPILRQMTEVTITQAEL